MAEKKVRVRMLRATIVEGEVAPEGKVVTVRDADARMLINAGKAEIVKKASKREAAVVEPPEDAAAPEPKAKKKKG